MSKSICLVYCNFIAEVFLKNPSCFYTVYTDHGRPDQNEDVKDETAVC